MNEQLDSGLIFPIIIGSLLFTLLAIFFIAFFLLHQKKRHQHQLEKEKLASEFAETLLQTQLEIKEQTLQNISYELHDNLGQVASLIKIHLTTIPYNNPKEALKTILETKELTKQLIKGIKLLSLDLNGDRLSEIGLLRALKEEVSRLDKLNIFKTTFEIEGEEFPLSKNKVIILYRMSQEIINNIIKHSNASEVLIKIHFLENFLTLVFHDNGLGFNVVEELYTGGSGLINLQNRAVVVNANFNIDSVLDKGTTVTIKIQK